MHTDPIIFWQSVLILAALSSVPFTILSRRAKKINRYM